MSIAPPTLTPAQLAAVWRIILEQNGAWARAFADGTAEAFSGHRGVVRRFTIDREGVERLAEEIPPSARFRLGCLIALTALVAAAVGVAHVVLRSLNGEAGGLWWMWPAGCLVAAFLTAAACFGIYARLPPPRQDAGPWIGLPRPREGRNLSVPTLPAMAKESPVFCGVLLVVFILLGIAIHPPFAPSSFVIPIGVVIGAGGWWAFMLGVNRGRVGPG